MHLSGGGGGGGALLPPLGWVPGAGDGGETSN